MARAKRKSFLPKKITSRRKSSGAARQLQGLHAAAVPSRNPFKLQEWQLRMSGIGVRGSSAGSGDPETDETEVEEEGYEARKTSYGAINPLMMEDEEGGEMVLFDKNTLPPQIQNEANSSFYVRSFTHTHTHRQSSRL